jgi:hypothetical protein
MHTCIVGVIKSGMELQPLGFQGLAYSPTYLALRVVPT